MKKPISPSAALAFALLMPSCAAFLVSGCASIVYSPANRDLNDPDSSGCDSQALEDSLVKSCRRLDDGASLKDAAPFFDVVRHRTVADPYKLSDKPSLAAQFFFELTPLGFISPLFDYPPRETVYIGRVEIPETAGRPAEKFQFRVSAGETFTKISGLETLSIRCRSRGCSLTSAPTAK